MARAIAFGPDRRFAIGGNREIGVWEGRRADTPAMRFPWRPGFTAALAFAGERLVGYCSDAQLVEQGVEVDLGTSAPALRRTELAELEPPSRAALVDDGSVLLRSGHRGGRIVLDVLDAPAGPLRRTIAIPGAGYVGRIAASSDGATIVLEVGEANAPQQLVLLRHAPSTDAMPRVLAGVDWNLRGLLVAPAGDAVIYDLHGALWHLPIDGVAAAGRPSSSAFLTAAAPSPPPALRPSAEPLLPIGLSDGSPPRRAPDERRTRALLVAGRAVDSYLLTRGQLTDIRALLSRRGAGLAAIVAGDENEYTPGEHTPADALYARVVIGVPVAEADCDLGPRGPLAPADLTAGLAAVSSLGDLFWRSVSSIIARKPAQFSAAARRAAVADHRIEDNVADIALDAADLLAIPDRLHLVPTGPLAYGQLVLGVPGPTPTPDDTTDPEERQHWHTGQDSTQSRHATAVRGISLATADAHGLGTASFALDDLTSRISAGVGLYLIARYD
jgi:hypothetical protein